MDKSTGELLEACAVDHNDIDLKVNNLGLRVDCDVAVDFIAAMVDLGCDVNAEQIYSRSIVSGQKGGN